MVGWGGVTQLGKILVIGRLELEGVSRRRICKSEWSDSEGFGRMDGGTRRTV